MPTTLRFLKKRSRQALAILQAHYPDQLASRTVFLAARDENGHGVEIRCGHPRRRTRFGCLRCTCPLPGTPMVGQDSGWDTPEWDEESAFETLQHIVRFGEQPATMTDREWRRTFAVARTTPITEADIAEWPGF